MSEHWEIFFLVVCSSRIFLRTVVLFHGNEKLEELIEGFEIPVRGIK